MKLDINNLSDFKIGKTDKKSFSQVAKKILSGENRETETLSLVFVSKEEMRELNKKYRRKDMPTDVLSFELSAGGGPALGGKKKYLGEIVICPEVVLKRGEEMMSVFVHGVLHLLGYEHEQSEVKAKKMEEREAFYLSKTKNR